MAWSGLGYPLAVTHLSRPNSFNATPARADGEFTNGRASPLGRPRFVLQSAILSAATGAAVMAIAARLSGVDPALKLAGQLNLASGIGLGAILGAVAGIWIALGSASRAAGFAGWLMAMLLGTFLWSIGRKYIWLLEVALVGAFGSNASGLAPFVGLGVLLAVVRNFARGARSRSKALISRLSFYQDDQGN